MNNLQMQGRIPFDINFFAAEGEKKAFASFTIAINTGVKGDDGYYKEDLFRCKAWGYTAEHLNTYFNTKDTITFDGKLTIGPDWKDKEGELQKGGPEILVNRIYGFGSKTKEDAGKASAPKAPNKPSAPKAPSKPSAPKAPAAPKRPAAPKVNK